MSDNRKNYLRGNLSSVDLCGGLKAEWDKWQPESGIELVFVKSFQGAKAYDGHAIVKCLC